MAIWNEKFETMSREEMREWQGAHLRSTVKRVYENVVPYRAKMDAIGLKPEDIRGIDDLSRLPFTTKQDLRDNFPMAISPSPWKR